MVAALGTNVTFTCIAVGTIFWSVNGAQIYTSNVEVFEEVGIFVTLPQPDHSTVTIFATPTNNGSYLNCLVDLFPQIPNISSEANFTTYGKAQQSM